MSRLQPHPLEKAVVSFGFHQTSHVYKYMITYIYIYNIIIELEFRQMLSTWMVLLNKGLVLQWSAQLGI